jgi:uncharacterized protein (TIGR02444 family)
MSETDENLPKSGEIQPPIPSTDEGGAERFWQFSCQIYQSPEVEPAALALQDDYELDVNLLLLCCFLGLHGVRATRETMATLDQHARAWRTVAVEPLRGLRRRLKQDVGAVSAQSAADFRAQVQSLELEAERLQQAMLFRTLERLPGKNAREAERAGLMRLNLMLYLAHAGVEAKGPVRPHLEAIVGATINAVLGPEEPDEGDEAG